MQMDSIRDAFAALVGQQFDYSLYPEFLETVMLNEVVPRSLCLKIWMLAATKPETCPAIAEAFVNNDSWPKLIGSWKSIVSCYWPFLPNTLAKRRVEELGKETGA